MRAIDYLKNSSEKFLTISKDYYNNFQRRFENLPADVRERDEVEHQFNVTCSDVDESLESMESSLQDLNELSGSDDHSLYCAVVIGQEIAVLYAKINSCIYFAWGRIFDLIK